MCYKGNNENSWRGIEHNLGDLSQPRCLKSIHGAYLSAQPDGSLDCDRTACKSWEKFIISAKIAKLE